MRVVFRTLNFPRRLAPLFNIISLFPALKELFVRRFRGTAAEPSAIAVTPMGLHKLELSEQKMSDAGVAPRVQPSSQYRLGYVVYRVACRRPSRPCEFTKAFTNRASPQNTSDG
jgi:hypothetical protein